VVKVSNLISFILFSSYYLLGSGLTVIPPGPVSNNTEIEIRINLSNPTDTLQSLTLNLYLNSISKENLIDYTPPIELFSDKSELIIFWLKTSEIIPGNHLVIVEIKDQDDNITIEQWPISVFYAETRTIPRLTGGWIDPGVLIEGWGYPRERDIEEKDIKNEIDAMKRIGMSTIIITYVEYKISFYPSNFLDFPYYGIDVVGLILEQADKNGMHVFLGLGRGNDDLLLWEGLGDYDRIQKGIDFSNSVAQELWDMYGHHPSFYGWYLTHEANDIGRASNYYNPVADFCKNLSPEKPVMIAPAGTPIISEWLLNTSKVDIFAYQDAVGAGYKNYEYTHDPEIRIADLDSVYGYYSSLHENTNKHIWTDLEIWRSNPETGYTPFIPGPIDQIKKQINLEAKYVDFITGYEFFSMMEPEESTLKLGGDKAVILYNQYLDYYNSNFLSIKKTSNNSKQSLEVIAYPNPFNNSTVFEIKNPINSDLLAFEIFDLQGRIVKNLDIINNQNQYSRIKWYGINNQGRKVSQGVYIGRLRTKKGMFSVKLLYLK